MVVVVADSSVALLDSSVDRGDWCYSGARFQPMVAAWMRRVGGCDCPLGLPSEMDCAMGRIASQCAPDIAVDANLIADRHYLGYMDAIGCGAVAD